MSRVGSRYSPSLLSTWPNMMSKRASSFPKRAPYLCKRAPFSATNPYTSAKDLYFRQHALCFRMVSPKKKKDLLAVMALADLQHHLAALLLARQETFAPTGHAFIEVTSLFHSQ